MSRSVRHAVQVLGLTAVATLAGAAVQTPVFVRHLSGQTSWFAGPIVYDLEGDGSNELIAAYYDVYVFSSSMTLLDRAQDGDGRVFAPHVVADLDGDGTTEVVAGRGHEVFAWEWTGSELVVKTGWPFDTTTAGSSPEVRGMAAGDLDGDGDIEVVVTTTQTQPTDLGGAQVFALSPDGTLFQPAGGHVPAWPRYNNLYGVGNDADRNGPGHSGYGCFGLNVGIGNLDDDAELEVVATYDNHHIQLFDPDGVAIDASSYFSNRSSTYPDMPFTWGQFIRWADPQVEEDHYHDHVGEWPHPSSEEWLQWTISPPSVADLDGDGQAEAIGVPNVELHVPYETQAWAVMVLEGAHGDGSRSARREPGWEQLPRGGVPITVSGWYPPTGIPVPTVVDLTNDPGLEIVVSLNDGHVHAFSAAADHLWSVDYRHGKPIMYSSEVTAVDLDGDESLELVFATFGDPAQTDSGNLMIVSADGSVLHDVPLPDPGSNGNGNGAPAAPGIGDLDGDGQLEIFVQTFDHAMDVFTVPGSDTGMLTWPTARGGPLRSGAVHWTGCLAGDADASISVGSADVIDVLGVLFAGDSCVCPDADCDGEVTAGDVAAIAVEWFDRGAGPCSEVR